jgi:predicted ArsR family transcriptional regulator
MFGPVMEENPTRQRILALLNRTDHLTVTDLSREMGITPMAVRQHLLSLEKKGVVRYSPMKAGIGRPVFQYSLTDKAQDLFPKGYKRFVNDMLDIIEEVDGRKKLGRLFDARKEKLLAERRAALRTLRSRKQQVAALADHLSREGYMAEWSEGPEGFTLRVFNCLIHDLIRAYPEACRSDLQLFRDLFGKGVERIQCQRDGAPSCLYTIPKA